MSLTSLFDQPVQHAERQSLPLLNALIERYRDEKPFEDLTVVLGYLLVRNSMVVFQAVWAGGANLVIADAHPSPATAQVLADLARHEVPVYSVEQAITRGDIFMDINAVLGRRRTPRAAMEITRTGVHHYKDIPCPVLSADNCKAKRIEGFFGTGDGFLRAWGQLRPHDPLAGKRLVQFGYGKIGRGVAHLTRKVGMQVTLAEVDPAARARAAQEGFTVVDGRPNAQLQRALSHADVVIAVTGLPQVIGQSLPPAWLRANRPVLVNLGAEDEFGPAFEEAEVLGGKAMPLNFHLEQPTLNRYVDAPLAAHVLALEAWARAPDSYPVGIHPLPEKMDAWLLRTWREHWPDEDLTGIGTELDLT